MEHIRFLSLLVALTLAKIAKGEEAVQVGRYQLCTGKIEKLFVGAGKDKSAVYPEQTVFKIDTRTGKVSALKPSRSRERSRATLGGLLIERRGQMRNNVSY